MLVQEGKATISEARNETSFLKKVLLISMVLNIGLLVLIAVIVIRERTIITPPVVTGKYIVSGAVGNEQYIVDMAEYVITTLRTINKDNVDNNNLIILRMTRPESVPKLRSVLDAQAKRIKEEDITTVWSGSTMPPKVIVDQSTVYLTGILKTYFSNKLVSEQPKKYKISFKMSGIGKIYVKSVEEIDLNSDSDDGAGN